MVELVIIILTQQSLKRLIPLHLILIKIISSICAKHLILVFNYYHFNQFVLLVILSKLLFTSYFQILYFITFRFVHLLLVTR